MIKKIYQHLLPQTEEEDKNEEANFEEQRVDWKISKGRSTNYQKDNQSKSRKKFTKSQASNRCSKKEEINNIAIKKECKKESQLSTWN